MALGGALLGGCEDGDSHRDEPVPACDRAFFGDPDLPPRVEAFFRGADEADHDLVDGASVDLVEPPQGGRVVFVGVRASNVDPCGLTITGALRDPATRQVRLDTRTINMVDDGAGQGRSASGELAAYANVPVCHNTWTDLDVFGASFSLEVLVRDTGGREASVTLAVAPTCAEPANEAECLCICAGDYELGEVCE